MTKNESEKAKSKAKLPPKTVQERADAFQADYKTLCQKHGLNHIAVPELRQSMDTGVWGIVISMRVGKMPK